MKRYFCFLFSCFMLIILKSQPLEKVSPEAVGMNAEQFLFADEAIHSAIQEGTIPGAVLAVVRQGKMAYLKAYGNKRVIPRKEIMTVNTVFDLASCSKPVSTAICTMKLIEQGKIGLLDPIKRYIPAFQNWKEGS